MDIRQGLTTGPAPVAPDPETVEHTHRIKEQTRLTHEELTLSGDEIKRALTAPDGIRAGLQEVEEIDPSLQAYFDQGGLQAEEQTRQERAQRDADLQELAERRAADVRSAGLAELAEGFNPAARAAAWSRLDPTGRVHALELGYVEEDEVHALNVTAAQHVESTRTLAQAMNEAAQAVQASSGRQERYEALVAEHGPQAAAQMLRAAITAAQESGVPLAELPPDQWASFVLDVHALDREAQRAEAVAAQKRAIMDADTTDVAAGIEVMSGGYWQRAQPEPRIVATPNYAAALAARYGGSGQPETVADLKASIIADPLRDGEQGMAAVQRKAAKHFGDLNAIPGEATRLLP